MWRLKFSFLLNVFFYIAHVYTISLSAEPSVVTVCFSVLLTPVIHDGRGYSGDRVVTSTKLLTLWQVDVDAEVNTGT